MDRKNNVDVLDELNKGALMGKNAIEMILDKVDDEKLKKELLIALKKYSDIANKIEEIYPNYENDKEPHKLSSMTKAMTWYGIEMKTFMDASSSKLAELLIQGTSMGIIEGRRLLNNNECDSIVHVLLDEYVNMQEEFMEHLKAHL